MHIKVQGWDRGLQDAAPVILQRGSTHIVPFVVHRGAQLPPALKRPKAQWDSFRLYSIGTHGCSLGGETAGTPQCPTSGLCLVVSTT